MGYLSDYLERRANGMTEYEANAAHIREMHEAFGYEERNGDYVSAEECEDVLSRRQKEL